MDHASYNSKIAQRVAATNNNNQNEQNMVACDFCGEDELWEEAHHFPNAIACRRKGCVTKGRNGLAVIIGEGA